MLIVLIQKLNDPVQKNVAIGRHVEQINAIQVAYIMDGGLEAKPPVQARSQFAVGGGCFGNLEAQPPAPRCQWGMDGSSQPLEARGYAALENFAFFCKNKLILELF